MVHGTTDGLVRAAPPAGSVVDDSGLDDLAPCPLTASMSVSLSVPFRGLGATGFSEDVVDRVVDLCNTVADPDALQLLGHARDVDYDPIDEVVKITGLDGWRLLLRIPSHTGIGTEFWDWYAAAFFVRHADLEARRFDRVHLFLVTD